ncbi:ASCH domain-containing protein [Alistipes indistinctus]|uniref:ASCH domain-containing protein n=1 Tax=Alistipes indistinctus TaxID=626932 RepID=UPI0032C0D07D
MKVLLSIKPQFVEEIFAGKKRFEYRKAIFSKDVDSVVIYSTKPVGKIVGEFTIKRILNNKPEQLWALTSNYSGISKDFFDQYFEDRDSAYALEIEAPRRYKKPINPQERIESFVAPQSFMYVNDMDYLDLLATTI